MIAADARRPLGKYWDRGKWSGRVSFRGAGVDPRKSLSEKSHSMSLSSIHILYTHNPVQAWVVHTRPWGRVVITFRTEVVLSRTMANST